MARQREEGYTQIDNSTLEKISKAKLNGTQFRIIMVVWRYTYGFQREGHKLSLTYISKATGIHKVQVQRELTKLIDNKILSVVKEASFNNSRTIAFNKNYNEWLSSEQLTNKLTDNEKDNHTDNELVNTTDNELVNQERKNLKKALKKNVGNEEENRPYKEIIDYLNNKANAKYRHTTKATQRLISARISEGYTLNDFKKVIDIKVDDWLNDKKMSMYLRPETLFNGTKFESYLNQRTEPSNKTITYKSHSLDDYVIPEPKETIFD